MSENSTSPQLLLLRVDEAAERLNLGRTVMYELIRSRRLRSVKIGRSRLIPAAALAEFVRDLERESEAVA